MQTDVRFGGAVFPLFVSARCLRADAFRRVVSGAEARNALLNIAHGRHVVCRLQRNHKTDAYGRIVGCVYTEDGREPGFTMTNSDHAWHDDIFCNDSRLCAGTGRGSCRKVRALTDSRSGGLLRVPGVSSRSA